MLPLSLCLSFSATVVSWEDVIHILLFYLNAALHATVLFILLSDLFLPKKRRDDLGTGIFTMRCNPPKIPELLRV